MPKKPKKPRYLLVRSIGQIAYNKDGFIALEVGPVLPPTKQNKLLKSKGKPPPITGIVLLHPGDLHRFERMMQAAAALAWEMR